MQESADSNHPCRDGIAVPRHVRYIDKSRDYYAAHGYEQPYLWANHDDAPFTPLLSPLAVSRVGVVSTSGLLDADGAQVKPKRAFTLPSSPVPDAMYTADLSWDTDATHTDDVGSFLPLAALHKAAANGRIGEVSPRFYGIPTSYSQRKTAKDAARIVEWCEQDQVDLVLLVPL